MHAMQTWLETMKEYKAVNLQYNKIQHTYSRNTIQRHGRVTTNSFIKCTKFEFRFECRKSEVLKRAAHHDRVLHHRESGSSPLTDCCSSNHFRFINVHKYAIWKVLLFPNSCSINASAQTWVKGTNLQRLYKITKHNYSWFRFVPKAARTVGF